MILEEKYTLNNGVQIPKLGLGTWFIDDAEVPKAVCRAVEIGYRHFDTAQLDFIISDADMELLKNTEVIKDYGEFSHFPVFSGK